MHFATSLNGFIDQKAYNPIKREKAFINNRIKSRNIPKHKYMIADPEFSMKLEV